MTKLNFLDILRTLIRHVFHKDVKMLASNASVPEIIGIEHFSLVHLGHAFSECIEDTIEKVKRCTVGNESLWLNQLAEKHRLKLNE